MVVTRCAVKCALSTKNTPPPRNGGEITTNTIFTNIFKQSRFAEKCASIVFLYCLRTNSRGKVNPFSHRVNISRKKSTKLV